MCAAMLLTGNVLTMTFAEETENTAGLDVRAMSFNVRYLLDDPYDAITYTAAQRKKVVLDQINFYSPDVLGVQEDTTEWKDVLTEGLSGYSVYTGAEIEGGSGYDASYNEIFYKTERFVLIESGCKWLTDTPDEKSSVAEKIHIRRVNYVILQDKTTGMQFCFANTHLHNGMDSPAQSYRALQAEYLMDILDGVTAKYQDIPVVLVGDFNGGTKTDTLVDVITQNGFSDARNIADTVESDINATWNTGYGNPANYGNASRVMDHCFVSSRVSVEKFRVATEKYPDASGNMLCTSDHFPLVVDTLVPASIDPDRSWYQENATEYRLYDAADLLGFADLLKEGTTFDGKTVYLCNDIALNGEPAYLAASTAHKASPFSGTFDGQGYVISGLYTYDTSNATGLIPYVANTATIQNVTVVNSSFYGKENASAVVGVYSASEKDARFIMKNVHVANTAVNGTTGTAGIVGMLGNFAAIGTNVIMENITFTGGSVTAVSHSGGMIGTVENRDHAYENGVTLTMDRIVASGAFTFTGTGTVASGCLIGDVAGFRSINITNVYTGGSLTAEAGAAGVTPFVAYVETVNTSSVMANDATAVRSTLNISNGLATPKLYNASHYLLVEGSAYSWSAVVTMKNTWNDISNLKEGSPGRKGPVNEDENYPDANDDYPAKADHQKTTDALQGAEGAKLFDGWIVAGDTSYPIPTARPARLLGWQSTYETDVTANGRETYSIRLIAALNDRFYTYAGFGAIEIEYKDAQGETVKLDKNDYRCQYVYNSVYGNGNEYKATDYHASYLFALELLEIPKEITEFSITVTPFSGRESVSLSGITRTVRISTATK